MCNAVWNQERRICDLIWRCKRELQCSMETRKKIFRVWLLILEIQRFHNISIPTCLKKRY